MALEAIAFAMLIISILFCGAEKRKPFTRHLII